MSQSPARAAALLERLGASAGTAVVRAPGRVNLIGEHTDYNEGFVLPAAIDLEIWLAIEPWDRPGVELFGGHSRHGGTERLGTGKVVVDQLGVDVLVAAEDRHPRPRGVALHAVTDADRPPLTLSQYLSLMLHG